MRLIDIDKIRPVDFPSTDMDGLDVVNFLNTLPTIEAEPVRHGYLDASGKYIFPDGSLAVRCSECGCDLEEHEYKEYWWHYCPVCGAKMDGEEKEE